MSKSNILLQGEIGTGKTRSLITLLPEYIAEDGEVRKGAGQHVALLSNEPGAAATLSPNLCGEAHGDAGIHLRYIQPLALSWVEFSQYMRLLNLTSLDKALEQGDPNKRRCTQFLDMMSALSAFVCDRCGADLGDVGEWDDGWTIAYDGLTGLTTIARHLCVGLKPILSRPEYNPVMGAIEGFLQLFWGSTKCNALMLAHIDREINPVTGLSGITAHTIGQKLAPRIVKMPDEVILAERTDDGEFTWSTDVPGQILKVRSMPRGAGLRPDFSAYKLFSNGAIK